MVGKTSLLSRYINDEFNKNLERTVNVNCCNKTLTINNTKYYLNIWVIIYLIRIQQVKKNITHLRPYTIEALMVQCWYSI